MNDDSARGIAPDTRRTHAGQSSPSTAGSEPPRTDIGTMLLHWLTVIAFVTSLFTGIRIAGDAIEAPVSKWLSPILPQGEIWTWHFLAGLTLFFCMVAYLFYLLRTGLTQRNALKKMRVLAMKAPREMKWSAVNVGLHWFVYGLVLLLTTTGVILYLGYGGWWVYIHSTAAFVGLAYIFVHVVAHYMYGGWPQILRLFRPARLVFTRLVRPKPLLVACIAGLIAAVAIGAVDWSTRDDLTIARVQQPPKLDGILDDDIWKNARPVLIHTQQGANLGNGESSVEVRAVHDGQKIYFAVKWSDPTRSLRRLPIVKKEDGWHVPEERSDRMDVIDFYEDKLSIIFSDAPSFGGAGVARLGPNPLPSDKPKPLNERGFHYTTDGSYVDMWQWKASRGGLLGHVDDQYIGPPRDPTADDQKYKSRYQAGYWNDPGRAFYSYNFKFVDKGDGAKPVVPLRLPKDLKKQVAALGRYDLDPGSIDDENGRWFMFDTESEPYTKEADAAIPVGTVLPGVIISGQYEGDRGQVAGAARWKDGHWYLETARNLKTGSQFDKDFVAGKPLYMWVAVFDHTQTRHTRHPRPVRITVLD